MAQAAPAIPKTNAAPGKGGALPRSFFRNDFPFLRKAAIKLGISVVVSAALIAGSTVYSFLQEDAKAKILNERTKARAKRSLAEADKEDVIKFQPQYVALMERGYIGDEKRIEWVEQMKLIQKNRRLLPMTYEVSAQQLFVVDPTIPMGTLELRGSSMALHMKLLHDMDLLHFLDDLKLKALYAPKSCVIKHAEASGTDSKSPRLTAECTLYWLSLARPAAPDAPPAAPPK